jgi:hypothetical protein
VRKIGNGCGDISREMSKGGEDFLKGGVYQEQIGVFVPGTLLKSGARVS